MNKDHESPCRRCGMMHGSSPANVFANPKPDLNGRIYDREALRRACDHYFAKHLRRDTDDTMNREQGQPCPASPGPGEFDAAEIAEQRRAIDEASKWKSTVFRTNIDPGCVDRSTFYGGPERVISHLRLSASFDFERIGYVDGHGSNFLFSEFIQAAPAKMGRLLDALETERKRTDELRQIVAAVKEGARVEQIELRDSIFDLRTGAAKLRNELIAVQSDTAKLIRENDALKGSNGAEAERLRKANADLSGRLETSRATNAYLGIELDRVRAAMTAADEKVARYEQGGIGENSKLNVTYSPEAAADLRDQRDRVGRENEDLRNEIKRVRDEAEKMSNANGHLAAELTKTNENFKTFVNELTPDQSMAARVLAAADTIERLKIEKAGIVRDISTLRKEAGEREAEMIALRNKVSNHRDHIGQLQESLRRTEVERDDFKTRFDRVVVQKGELRRDVDRLRATGNEAVADLEKAKTKLAIVEREGEQLARSHEAMRQELIVLTEKRRDDEGVILGLESQLREAKAKLASSPVPTLDIRVSGRTYSPPIAHLMQFFKYDHLPAHLQAASKPFAEVASLVATFQSNAETVTALRKLLEAKDAAVRGALLPPAPR